MLTYSREELLRLIGEADTAESLQAIAYIIREEEDYLAPVHFIELSGMLEMRVKEIALSHMEVWQMIIQDIQTLQRA